MMDKKILTTAEILYTIPNPHNLDDVVQFYAANCKKFSNFFIEHGFTRDKYDCPKGTHLGTEVPEFAAAGIVYEALHEKDERKETSRRERKRSIQLWGSYIKRVKLIVDDPSFCRLFGLDRSELMEKRERLEREVAFLKKNTRAGEIKPIEYWLSQLIPFLRKNGFGETERVNFVYDLLVKFGASKTIFKGNDAPMTKRRRLEAAAIQRIPESDLTLDTGEIDDISAKDRIRAWDKEVNTS